MAGVLYFAPNPHCHSMEAYMKIIFTAVLCLCLATIASTANECQYFLKDTTESNDKKILYKGRPVTGVLCSYGTDSNPRIKSFYKDGVEDGIRITTYKNGQVFRETPYKKGIVEGLATHYYESGQILEEIPYRKGVREGITKEYYVSGQISQEIPYENGRKEGISKHYYENGQLMFNANNRNNLVEGIIEIYNENGRLKMRILSISGKPVEGTCADGSIIPPEELKNFSVRSSVCD